MSKMARIPTIEKDSDRNHNKKQEDVLRSFVVPGSMQRAQGVWGRKIFLPEDISSPPSSTKIGTGSDDVTKVLPITYTDHLHRGVTLAKKLLRKSKFPFTSTNSDNPLTTTMEWCQHVICFGQTMAEPCGKTVANCCRTNLQPSPGWGALISLGPSSLATRILGCP